MRVYWDTGVCGPEGDDANWDICGQQKFDCPNTIDSKSCPNGKAKISRKEGTGTNPSVTIGNCSYAYYVEYSCPTGKLEAFVAVSCFFLSNRNNLESQVFLSYWYSFV